MIYEYRCGQGHTTEAVRTVSSRNDPIDCGTCGAEMRLIPSVPASRAGYSGRKVPYWCLPPRFRSDGTIDTAGESVDSPEDYRKLLAKNNLSEPIGRTEVPSTQPDSIEADFSRFLRNTNERKAVLAGVLE